jgi:Cupin superfamily protein
MTADTSAVVARLGGDTFLTQAFGRSYHKVEGDPKLIAGIIGWNDINEIIGRHRLEAPRLRLSSEGVMVSQDAYTTPTVTRRNTVWRRIHPASFHEQLANGASLVIDAIDELHPGVHQLASELERLFRTSVQVNAYGSWTAKEGFGTHWDDHDVVIVQLEGAKRWRLFGQTRIAPMHRDVVEPPPPPDQPVAEFLMTPGDVLYLPRGWWHSVSASEGERTLHLTCGLGTKTGSDLVTWLSETLRGHEVLRTDVPRFGTTDEKQTFVDTLRTLLNDEMAYGSLIDEFAKHGDAIERARLRPSLPFVLDVPDDPGLCMWLMTSRHSLQTNEDGTVTLVAGDKTWTYAEAARPVLERLADGDVHRLADLIAGTSVSIGQAAKIAGELVRGQVAAVGGE